MLERYFIRPTTVDRIRACWIGDAIERYVTWLAEQGYATRNVAFRVPVLVRFGEFARTSGAINWNELPSCIEPFVEHWLKERRHDNDCESARRIAAREVRNPIQQMLHLIVPDYQNKGRSHELIDPFIDSAPGFFEFLRQDRGLREPTIVQYQHYLRRTECYFRKSGIESLADLSPAVVTALITESGKSLDKRSVQSLCSILKVFFRYLHRAGLVARDLSRQIESPRRYRLADLPRSISWDEVRRMLQAADRRTPLGKRDYAILLLLVTYGLRAREVAALTLDDIDWKHDRLHVRGRKADHSAIYPLVPAVGEAILDYLQHGRPKLAERCIFLSCIRTANHTVAGSGLFAGETLYSQGWYRSGAARFTHAAPHLRTKARGGSLVTQDHWRLYGSSHSERHRDLRQGEHRGPSRSCSRRWRGDPVKTVRQGPLASSIDAYLAHKRALGKQLEKTGPMLHLLNGYLVEHGVAELAQITPANLEAFVGSRPRPSPRSYNELLGMLRRLFDWLVRQEKLATSPLQCSPRRVTPGRKPFLFSPDEARRLLHAARHLRSTPRSPFRGETYRMIFAILYGLGLRVGEVSRLRRKDVDLTNRLLVIRQTKFGKDRLVPFGPRMAREISEYLQREEVCSAVSTPDCAVFSFAKNKQRLIRTTTMSWIFHKLITEKLSLVIPAGVAPPHLHCLRHSFAVGTLLRWYRAGLDPMSRLLDLSTFLGHVSPSSPPSI